MNGQKAKMIRKLGLTVAHSINETTLKGVKVSPRSWALDRGKYINYEGHIHYQRILSPFSLRSICKKLKNAYAALNKDARVLAKPVLETLMLDKKRLGWE